MDPNYKSRINKFFETVIFPENDDIYKINCAPPKISYKHAKKISKINFQFRKSLKFSKASSNEIMLQFTIWICFRIHIYYLLREKQYYSLNACHRLI